MRQILGMTLLGALAAMASARPPGATLQKDNPLAFQDDGQGNLVFNTGVVRGTLKKDGLSSTLKSLTFLDGNTAIDTHHGLLVPYRFLTPQKRYGFGSWEWPRTGRLQEDGSAVLRWEKADERPFAFSVAYAWKAADTLDMTVVFTPSTALQKFELFFGSYFPSAGKVAAYVKDTGDGKRGFRAASPDKGTMQLFPRDDQALELVRDGRWTFPPGPNNWVIHPGLAAPLGIRADPQSGVTVVFMAPPEDCFAVSAMVPPNGGGAFYLSLFGKDLQKGQSLTGRARLVFGKNLTDAQVVQAYEKYVARR